MRKLIVANIISVDGFYSGPNDNVMAMDVGRLADSQLILGRYAAPSVAAVRSRGARL